MLHRLYRSHQLRLLWLQPEWKDILFHLWGYDLLNEPREENYIYTPDGGLDWNRLAEKIAKAIREVDPDTPIIIEPAQWGGAAGFENLIPVDVPNVIYSFHIDRKSVV